MPTNQEYKKFIETMKRLDDMSGVFTPENPHWEAFVVRLAGREGIYAMLGADGDERNNCPHEKFPYAKQILLKMADYREQDSLFDIDIEKTLNWFELQGRSCDCEIVYRNYEFKNENYHLDSSELDWDDYSDVQIFRTNIRLQLTL